MFDLDKIHGGLDVRWGKAGETLKLLNGNTVAVDEWVGVIADHQEIESLAGIMGGDSTAVTLETENIYLESAFWWPQAIQGRARRLNFSTDAAHRFERGVDFLPADLRKTDRSQPAGHEPQTFLPSNHDISDPLGDGCVVMH